MLQIDQCDAGTAGWLRSRIDLLAERLLGVLSDGSSSEESLEPANDAALCSFGPGGSYQREWPGAIRGVARPTAQQLEELRARVMRIDEEAFLRLAQHRLRLKLSDDDFEDDVDFEYTIPGQAASHAAELPPLLLGPQGLGGRAWPAQEKLENEQETQDLITPPRITTDSSGDSASGGNIDLCARLYAQPWLFP